MVADRPAEVALGTVLEPVLRAVPVEPEGRYRLLGVRWYGNGCRLHSEVVGAELKTAQLNRVERGDVVYNKMWTTKAAFAVVDDMHSGLVATSEYPTFAVRANLADPAFLRYAMLHPEFVTRATDACRGTTSRVRLNPKDFLRLHVFLPALPEQRKIAAILTALHDVSQKTEAVIESLQALMKAMMQELLTHGVPGRHVCFKRTEVGEIPREWEVSTLGELCSRIVVGIVVKPTSYYVPSGVPALRSKNVREGRVDLDDLVYISKESNEHLSKSQIRSGDVLTVRTGEPGTSCIVPPELDGANCIDIILSTPGSRLLPHFMALCLNGAAGRAFIQIGKGGLAQQHFNVGAMKQMPIAVPPIAEQREIATALSSLDERLNQERAVSTRLAHLKSALMSVLLTGELRVISDEVNA